MSNELAVFKKFMGNDATKKRFNDILDKNASSFMASVVNAVSGNDKLAVCEPSSIMNAAFVAAALKLPIDPNLGFAYIIPYNSKNNGNKAQFQLGWKGYVQLAVRTGLYEKINVSEIYEDELEFYNPITGDLKLTDINGWEERYKTNGKVAGYYALFKLKTGFFKDMFMSHKEVDLHAKKYSQSYKKGWSSIWSTDFDSMAKKTVLKQLLSKYGIMSVEMQQAFTDDQKVDDEYADNPQTEIQENANQGEIIDIPAEPAPTPEQPKKEKPAAKSEPVQGSIIDEEAGF